MTLFHASTAGYALGHWDDGWLHMEGWEPTVQDAQASAEYLSTIIDETVVVYALVPLSAFGGTPGDDHA